MNGTVRAPAGLSGVHRAIVAERTTPAFITVADQAGLSALASVLLMRVAPVVVGSFLPHDEVALPA